VTAGQQTGARLASLDAVRGFAVLLVVGYHASFRFPASANDFVAGFIRSIGWIGVDVFFALSGFLIAGILLRTRDRGREAIVEFFRRRVFRIVPLYLLAVATYLIVSLIVGHELEALPNLWMTALLLNGWVIPFLGVENVPYTIAWSLSVEEFSYVALGIAAAFSRKAILRTIGIFLIGAVVVRWLMLGTEVIDIALIYYFVPARLDSIALGALGAVGVYGPLSGGRWSSWLGGSAVLGLMILFQWAPVGGWFLPAVGYTVFGLVAAIWVAQLASVQQTIASPVTRMLAAVGEVSYFIYLFHMFVLDAVRMAASEVLGINFSFWPALLLSVLLVYFAARVSWRFFEAPLIARGRRKQGRSAASAGTGASP
jgi:peptidoglycan/LPS O-acetylase OafA/YrhL